MGDFIFFIIIAIVVAVGRILQSVSEKQAKQNADRQRPQGHNAGQRASHSASPEDIREFLSGLSKQAQAREPASRPVPPPPAAPAVEPQEARAPEPLAAEMAPVQVADTGRSGGMPSGPTPMRRATPLQKSQRTKQAKKPAQKRRRQPTIAAEARQHLKTESRPVSASTTGLPTGTSLRGGNLRQAVIWSEILGRPVGMRRRGGPRPPSARR